MNGDLAAVSSALVERLREAGAAVDITAGQAYAAAMTDRVDTEQAYWVGRVTLVRCHADLTTYDQVFAEIFGDTPRGRVRVREDEVVTPRRSRRATPQRPPEVGRADGLPWVTPIRAEGSDESDGSTHVPLARASTLPGRADLADLAADDLDRLGEALREAMRDWPTRRTRRRAEAPRGTVDLRRTAAHWSRTGGEPLRLARSRARHRRRRLVVVCDVSESMRTYVVPLLHLLRATTQDGGEAFAVATRLTRLTPVLRERSARDAVQAAAEAVGEESGGTRIATSLRQLLGSHHGDLLRGAVVVVVSDGWDADPPEDLRGQMIRLRRRTHRLVWLNPRAGAPGYQPEVAGMAAALPFCDAMLPAGTVAEMEAAVAVLGSEVSSTTSRTRQDGTV